MAHKTKAVRLDKYDTETIMSQVNRCGFVYRTSGNGALIDVLVKDERLEPVSGVEGRYEKRVKATN